MRPQSLDDFVGQKHILGEGKLLTRAIEADRITSLIFYGPPGVGKTTLAECISRKTKSFFESVNAVCSNVEELRKVLSASRQRKKMSGQKTILFIDEIHRFNKAQQDVLMPDLEKGDIVLVGATVLNPFFTLIGPLLSRSMVFELKSHSQDDILAILTRALKDQEKGLGQYHVKADQEALVFLSKVCDGDARRALNALEVGVLTTKEDPQGSVHFTLEVAQESIQKKQICYDRDGDAHYDTASAFIKSMRGSDADATLYWLAKMIYAGEDPRFIARRICICASEDVGNADPQALVLASAALQISEFVGLPEARIPLAQAAVYVACAPKSNASYLGIEKALKEVEEEKLKEVPMHLKDASYKKASALGHGEGYKYAHDYPNHFVAQEYLPSKAKFYEPTNQGFEEEIQKRLKKLKESS
ncbi:MAG: replication-associated recombination protein A [Candidatus Omnitrophota bacterium]